MFSLVSCSRRTECFLDKAVEKLHWRYIDWPSGSSKKVLCLCVWGRQPEAKWLTFYQLRLFLYTSENTKRVICTVLIGGLFNDYNKRSELVKFSHFTGTIEHRRSFNFDPFMSLLNAGVFKQTNKQTNKQVNYLASSFFVRKNCPSNTTFNYKQISNVRSFGH